VSAGTKEGDRKRESAWTGTLLMGSLGLIPSGKQATQSWGGRPRIEGRERRQSRLRGTRTQNGVSGAHVRRGLVGLRIK